MRTRLALCLALVASAVAPAAAGAADVPDNATWTEATIPSSEVTLHADILRPKDLAPTAQTSTGSTTRSGPAVPC